MKLSKETLANLTPATDQELKHANGASDTGDSSNCGFYGGYGYAPTAIGC